MTSRDRARRLLAADAAFELALALPLLTGPATGLHRVLRLPPPATSPPLTAAFGGALLPVAALLWRARRRPARRPLQALATANATTGVLFAAWLAGGRGETTGPGAAALGVTAAALVALALAQARVARALP
jgi:hypothetical protein